MNTPKAKRYSSAALSTLIFCDRTRCHQRLTQAAMRYEYEYQHLAQRAAAHYRSSCPRKIAYLPAEIDVVVRKHAKKIVFFSETPGATISYLICSIRVSAVGVNESGCLNYFVALRVSLVSTQSRKHNRLVITMVMRRTDFWTSGSHSDSD